MIIAGSASVAIIISRLDRCRKTRANIIPASAKKKRALREAR